MILVTGAGGYVGSRVVEGLAGAGDSGARDGIRALMHRTAAAPAGVEVVTADLAENRGLEEAVRGVNCLVHCAAITGEKKEPYRGAYDRINRVGTENLVRAASGAGVGRIVLVSGLGTREARPGTYMATRWGMEQAVTGSGMSWVVLRPSVLFGKDAPFVAALAKLIRQSPVVPLIGGGGLRFQPLHVDDLVRCVTESVGDGFPSGQVVTLGGSEQLTFAAVLREIARAIGRKRLFAPLPMPLARVQARLMYALMRRPPLTPAALELFGFDNVTDIDSVRDNFGFQPRGFITHLRAAGLE
ncbi:MAG: SDR family oxidoreductase [Candidatus Dormibacteria bacterium]